MSRSHSKRSDKKNALKGLSNPVAKNMEKFNRPSTHLDKKKESKINGHSKDKAWKRLI